MNIDDAGAVVTLGPGLEFDGGGVYFQGGTTDLIVTGNKFYCNMYDSNNNEALLLGAGGIDTNPTIRENLFLFDSDCLSNEESWLGVGWTPSGDPDDYPGAHPGQQFISWDTEGMTVEYNDFVVLDGERAETAGWKATSHNGIWRNNFMFRRPLWIGTSCGGLFPYPSCGNNRVYQNIFVGGARIGAPMTDTLKVYRYAHADKFYNNTVFSPQWKAVTYGPENPGSADDEQEFFNNIVYLSTTTTYGILDYQCEEGGTTTCQTVGNTMTTLDYNLYYAASGSLTWDDNNNTKTGLASWKSYLAATYGTGIREASSTEANPLFVDVTSGAGWDTMADPSDIDYDFHLQAGSPALTGGRGGSYSTVRGAYITGTEQIGCSTWPECHYATPPPSPACNDGIDNDGDGQTDYPADPGCTGTADTSEYGTVECDDGVDNDTDGLTDYRTSGGDPECVSLTDATEAAIPPGAVVVTGGALAGADVP